MVDSAAIARAVYDAVGQAASTLRPDVLAAVTAACSTEVSERGRDVLGRLVENASVAKADGVPLCQDTGTVRVRVETGADACLGPDLQVTVDAAVASACVDFGLRASVVRDALLDRANTGDDTPAFIEVVPRAAAGARVEVTLKGGGSDNASCLVMLDPSAGEDGVVQAVVDAVKARGASACPPLLVGVGVGSTFDKVAGLAGRALSRRIGEPGDPRTIALEARLLEAVNATGIGPGGLGGSTTALAVHVATAPCHIACLPVAVILGCCAVRCASVEIV
jgi:fumarate hydratase subunit alpha